MADDPLKQPALRCFLAMPLHELFSEELDRILGPLRRGVSGVRWVESRQVHLTLHFFGPVPAGEIERIDAAMREIAPLCKPLRIALDRVGGFPSLERPSIVWLGVEERTGALSAFQKTLCEKVQRLGYGIETRPFHPHATIGRVKKRAGDLKTLLAGVPSRFPPAEKIADHFVLYQSHCLPDGARYEILKTYPFSQKA